MKFIDEVLNLELASYIECLDNSIKEKASKMNAQIEDIIDLIECKIRNLKLYNLALEKFKRLDAEDQYIVYNYILRNKRSTELCKKLNISERTFFRRLNEIEKKWYRS